MRRFNKKIFPWLGLLVFRMFIVEAQTDLTLLSEQLTDSTVSDLQNAKNIYNWVTNNIRYDARAFRNFKYTNRTPEQTINKGKGLCTEYASLMAGLCNEAGIETYVIGGYTKGAGYQPGQPFLRSNHAWCVVLIDSAWIHVDPTYGSGVLINQPGIPGRWLMPFLEPLFMPMKPGFVVAHDDSYFDLAGQYLGGSHYPANPAWFTQTIVPSYYSFEQESDSSLVRMGNFQNEINDLRQSGQAYRQYREGVQSNTYNYLNSFDYALGIMKLKESFNPAGTATENNLSAFEAYLESQQLANVKLLQHKRITDSVYRSHIRFIRQLNSREEKIYERIRNRKNSMHRDYRKVIQRTFQKDIALGKSMSRERDKKFRMESKIPAQRSLPEDSLFDYTSWIQSLYANLLESDRLLDREHQRLDSLLNSALLLIENQSSLNDSLTHIHKQFLEQSHRQRYLCYADNERLIDEFLADQENAVVTLRATYIGFRASKLQVSDASRSVFDQAKSIESLLVRQQELIREIYAIPGANDTLWHLAEHNRELIENHFDIILGYYDQLLKYIELQREFYDVNLYYHRKLTYTLRQQHRSWNQYYRKKTRIIDKKWQSETEITRDLLEKNKENIRVSNASINRYRASEAKTR